MHQTWALPSPSTTVSAADRHECRCGHLSLAHEHYRRGRDCVFCACPRFRDAMRMLRRWVRDEGSGAA